MSDALREQAGVRLNERGNGCAHVMANRVLNPGKPGRTYCWACAQRLQAAREQRELGRRDGIRS